MNEFSGRLWRVLFVARAKEALQPARHPEGRFNHEGQRALHASPAREAARMAIESFLRPDDPPRVHVPLRLEDARLLDFRDPATSGALGLDGDEATTNWRAARAAGLPARS